MKNNLKLNRALRGGLGSLAALTLTLGLNASAQPFASPVGNWDVVESGVREGVAQMTFNPDSTISMAQIIVPKSPVSLGHTVTDTRGLVGDDSRNGTLPQADALPLHTNLYGFVGVPSGSEVNFTNADGSAIWIHDGAPFGRWGFDLKGRLVGFFSEVSAPSAVVTNLIPIGTEIGGTNLIYLTNVEVLRLTNAVSFTGKVSLNMSDLLKSRLTLLASTPAGKVTFSGVVPIELPDLSGDWVGLKKQAGLPYTEFFTLTDPDSLFTSYTVANGDGPSYVFGPPAATDGAICIVVRQKKAGFAYRIIQPHAPPIPPEQDLPQVIRALIGSMDLNHGKFSGRGLEGFNASPARITYKANLLPSMVE